MRADVGSAVSAVAGFMVLRIILVKVSESNGKLPFGPPEGVSGSIGDASFSGLLAVFHAT